MVNEIKWRASITLSSSQKIDRKKVKHLSEESARMGAAKSKSQFRLYKDRTHNSMQTKLGNDTDNRCLSISVRCQHKIT